MSFTTRSLAQRIALIAAATTMVLATTSIPASAEDLLVIPIDNVVKGDEGEVVEVASVDVPADLVGQQCTVTGETDNQESVHIGNDLIVVAGDQTFEVTNFEDVGFIVHQFGQVEILPTSIQVFTRFGPDRISSGGFKVIITDCSIVEIDVVDEPVTTVTTTAVSTTASSTTLAPSTTAVPPAGPSVDAQATTTTTAPTTTTSAAVAGGESLPVTGNETTAIVAIGLSLLVAGFVLRKAAVRA